MPLTYLFEQRKGYLLITNSGFCDDVGDLLQYAAVVSFEVAKSGADKVLIDELARAINMGFNEKLLNAKPFSKKSASYGLVNRVAVLCQSHSYALYSFIIEKMNNLTHAELAIFLNIPFAEAWLMSE